MPFLDDLVASTKKRVSEAKELVNAEVFEQRISAASPARGFEHALSGPGVSLVGEIVRRGPHCRLLNPHMNVTDQARAYARGGACAVSVVTEPDFYEGSLEDLTKALAAELPLLRRDLIVDQFQVMESRAWRADAVVFLARAVGDGLRPLLSAARALRMDSLVEVHDE
ncbi:MAG TPA: indole-3-glycerol-phosphate synthase TrpC, partial [Actinomycetota bacterium]|nr:indole-3-glycerol-phosphate synthase TrpC [Actinomycetota bacterium]